METNNIKIGDVVMCWRPSQQEYWTCKILEVNADRIRPIKLCPYYGDQAWLWQTFQCSEHRLQPLDGFEPTLGRLFTNPPPAEPPVERPAYAQRSGRRKYDQYYRQPRLTGEIEIGDEYLWGKGSRYESVLRVTGFDEREDSERWVRSDDLTSGARIGHPESVFRDNCIPFTPPPAS
jgi:hypothetical protein